MASRRSMGLVTLAACASLCALAHAPTAHAQMRLQSLIFEGGVRTGLGPARVPGPAGSGDRSWELMYHAGVMALLGASPKGGLLLSARWDGFDPNGRSGFPWALSARVGLMGSDRTYITPGMREHSSSSRRFVDSEGVPCYPGDQVEVSPGVYMQRQCYVETETETRRWWDPGGGAGEVWQFGAGFRHVSGMRQGADGRDGDPIGSGGAATLFVAHQMHRDGWAWTGIVDLEAMYYLYGWHDHARFGLALRLGVRVGPVTLDIYLRADPGTGTEATFGPTVDLGY